MATVFGAFGKMPALGDFLRQAAPQSFVPVWDAWLQTTLLYGRANMGDNWDANYMSAPIWRFTLSAGLAGDQKILGILTPSVDRVGRQYPLTLMTEIGNNGLAAQDHFGATAVFEKLETVALDALGEDMSPAVLSQRLADIEPPEFEPKASHIHPSGGGLIAVVKRSATPEAAVAAHLLTSNFQQPSFWAAEVEDEIRMMVIDGLPNQRHALGLYDLNADVWQSGAAA
jgi:type VI secretion system protein ImpM